MSIDLTTRRANVVSAGTPHIIIISDKRPVLPRFTDPLPLDLFADIDYA